MTDQESNGSAERLTKAYELAAKLAAAEPSELATFRTVRDLEPKDRDLSPGANPCN